MDFDNFVLEICKFRDQLKHGPQDVSSKISVFENMYEFITLHKDLLHHPNAHILTTQKIPLYELLWNKMIELYHSEQYPTNKILKHINNIYPDRLFPPKIIN